MFLILYRSLNYSLHRSLECMHLHLASKTRPHILICLADSVKLNQTLKLTYITLQTLRKVLLMIFLDLNLWFGIFPKCFVSKIKIDSYRIKYLLIPAK